MKTLPRVLSLVLLATGCGNANKTSVGLGEGGTHAGDKQWLTSLPDALAQAKADKKLVLLDFTGSDWCPPCKMLHDKVLTQKEFLDHASQNLVLVMLDFPRGKPQTDELKKANQDLSEKFKIRGYPTLVLLDDEGNELAREVGLAHQNPAELIAWVKDKGAK
jgi:thiol-disulfide isomerase/thioredoxin